MERKTSRALLSAAEERPPVGQFHPSIAMPPAESQTLKNLAAKRAATKNPTTPMVTRGTNHIENVRK